MSNNLLHSNYEFPHEEIKKTEYQTFRVGDSSLHHENIDSYANYINNERVNKVNGESVQLMNNNNYLHSSSNEMSWEVEDYKIYDLDSIKLQPQKNNNLETNNSNSVTGNKDWDADDILQMIGDNSSLEIVENYEERKKIEYSNNGRNCQLENSININNDKFQKLTSDTNENSHVKTSEETKDTNMTDTNLQVALTPTTASTEQVNSTPVLNMLPVSYTDYYKNLFQVQPFPYHPIPMNQMGQNILPFVPIFPGLYQNFCLPMNYFPFIPYFTFFMPMAGIAPPVNSVPEEIPVKPEAVGNLSIEKIDNNSINTNKVNNEKLVNIETRDLQPKVLIEKIKSPESSSTKQVSQKSIPKKCATVIIPKSDSQKNSSSKTKKPKIESSKTSKKKLKNEYSNQNNAAEGFECPKCSYVATQLGNLKRHMAVHLEERPFKCLDCPFTTRYSYSLQCHIRRHSGERPFECDGCQSKFITSSNLNHHKFIAHKVCPSNASLKCKHCKMTFSNIQDLKQHKSSHRTKHIYRCKLCFYTSTSSITYKNHVSKHDNPSIYICYDCGKQFVQKAFLEKHIINHHNL